MRDSKSNTDIAMGVLFNTGLIALSECKRFVAHLTPAQERERRNNFQHEESQFQVNI